MKKILALGSSHLASFKTGVDFCRSNGDMVAEIDFAGIWETGFRCLYIDGSYIAAPDYVPPQNNPRQINLKQTWKIAQQDKIPNLDDYDSIFIFASPSKLFHGFYYHFDSVAALSEGLIHEIILGNYICSELFESISPWQLHVSKIIRDIVALKQNQVFFVGGPLPVEGLEADLTETLRGRLLQSASLTKIHLNNVNQIRRLSEKSLQEDWPHMRFLLQPERLLCDLQISTKKEYEDRNKWHANIRHGVEMIRFFKTLGVL
jgi:hypothetical protein